MTLDVRWLEEKLNDLTVHRTSIILGLNETKLTLPNINYISGLGNGTKDVGESALLLNSKILGYYSTLFYSI